MSALRTTAAIVAAIAGVSKSRVDQIRRGVYKYSSFGVCSLRFRRLFKCHSAQPIPTIQMSSITGLYLWRPMTGPT